MSENALPITPIRFSEALQELPVESLHTTAAEIINSLTHLADSNEQLLPFAAEGDAVCTEAIAENEAVITRMKARIDLLRAEVERRGLPWPSETGHSQQESSDRDGQQNSASSTEHQSASAATPAPRQNGSLSDEELRRQMERRMQDLENGDDDDEGVHL